MIHPDNKWKHRWDTIVTLFTIYIAVEIPARLVLKYHDPGFLRLTSIAITVIFLIDIIIHFRSSSYVNNYLVTSPRSIARIYIKTWFFPDLIAALPFSYVIGELFLGYPHDSYIVNLLWATRLIRIFHLMSLYKRWQEISAFNPSVLRLLFFIFWISLIAHWAACGWIMLDGIQEQFEITELYVRSLYWSVTTLTTVGYGDITPHTIPQTIYNMIVMILGVGIYGYVIGNIASLLANIDVAKAHHQEKMERINAFLKYRNIPPSLAQRITGYYKYLWESRLGYDESTVISDLPPGLKGEISLHLNREIIEKVPMFKGAGEELIREIVLHLRPMVVTPQDYVFRRGELGDEMYFINRGSVEILAPDGDVIATLSGGSFFGEIALLLSGPRTASVRAMEYCDLYILDKVTFDRILERYPDFEVQIKDMARKRQEETSHHKSI